MVVRLSGGTVLVDAEDHDKVSMPLQNDAGIDFHDLTICVTAPGVTNTGKIKVAKLLDESGVQDSGWEMKTKDGQDLPNPFNGAECVKLVRGGSPTEFKDQEIKRLDVDIEGRGKRSLKILPTTQEGRAVIGALALAGKPADLDAFAVQTDGDFDAAGAAISAAGTGPPFGDDAFAMMLTARKLVVTRTGES